MSDAYRPFFPRPGHIFFFSLLDGPLAGAELNSTGTGGGGSAAPNELLDTIISASLHTTISMLSGTMIPSEDTTCTKSSLGMDQ